jgi:predicted protein tyrosine phosphatase
MIFEYDVTSLINAERAMRERWPSHIISALGPSEAYTSSGENHLVVEFDDTEVDNPDSKWIAAKREDIERIFAFTKNLGEEDRLLVHCKAGHSRSPAILMGVLMQHGMSAGDAFESVLQIRPAAIPNRMMVDLIDEVLGTDGALGERVAEYYKRLMIPGVHLPNRGDYMP